MNTLPYLTVVVSNITELFIGNWHINLPGPKVEKDRSAFTMAGSQYKKLSIIVYLPGTKNVTFSGSVWTVCAVSYWFRVLALNTNFTLYYKYELCVRITEPSGK